MTKLKRAIIAGQGALPDLLIEAGPAVEVRFGDIKPTGPGPHVSARLEQLGHLFHTLREAGVTEICFAGGMLRTTFDRDLLDAETAELVPRVMEAQGLGDDALFRVVIAIFEEKGFHTLGAHEVRPDLLMAEGAGVGIARPDGAMRRVPATSWPLSVRLMLARRRWRRMGNSWASKPFRAQMPMLRFVAETAPNSGGVLVKRAKRGQDLRIDMPAVGPRTVEMVAAAGLSGIELQIGHVLLLDPEAVFEACRDLDIALWGVD